MTSRMTIYIDEETRHMLRNYNNKSRVVKEALNIYLMNKEFFLNKKKKVEDNIRELEFNLDEKNLELDYLDKQIEKIERRSEERPVNYHRAVSTLKCLPDVNEDDLCFQAARLNIDVARLKSWLWFDGYYDEIFRKE